jgi:hypothetical protein
VRRAFVVLLALAAATTLAASAFAARPHAASAPATVWLCRPGLAVDPCTVSLSATVVTANGKRTVQTAQPSPDASKFDCFYVYPTVSLETTPNSDLRIQPAEQAVAVAQASRFSQVCRVWAPMYRQETLPSLVSTLASGNVLAAANALSVAYESLLGDWQDYLAHDNDGRPILFIGHSQGAAMLIRLLESQVDPSASLRARMLGAIILGGNVTVPIGKTVGATFHNIPACTRPGQFGCVIAYSSFPSQPPATSLFGRPGRGVSLQSGQLGSAGLEVLCVNPAAIGGGNAQLAPYFPALTSPPPGARVTTPWVEYPGLYTASCHDSGGASWLQVTASTATSDTRPRVSETDGPDWGFHTSDVNLGLGDLVVDVAAEEAAYLRTHH